MANIIPGNSYLVIPAADLQALIDYGYGQVTDDFCLTHPNGDTTYLYAPIGEVDETELAVLFMFYYGDDEYEGDAPIFNFMVSNQVPGPSSLWT